MESDPEPDPYSPPKLPLFSIPPHLPEPSGVSTPPLETAASVPFRWEEHPGKPRPYTNIIIPSKTPPNRRLDLPPRLATVELQSNAYSKVKGSNLAADRINGFSLNPATDRLSGFSTNPDVDRLSGFSSNLAADRLREFSSNPAADRLDGFKSRSEVVNKKKSSPTTVLDGPGIGDVGPKSLFSSFRFPKERRRHGSFDSNDSGGWSPVGCSNDGGDDGGGRLFGSFRLRRNASVSKVRGRSKFLVGPLKVGMYEVCHMNRRVRTAAMQCTPAKCSLLVLQISVTHNLGPWVRYQGRGVDRVI